MAGSVNKAILVGNVGRDPEIRSTQAGKEIASFSLATSESWRDRNSGERKERVEWHRVAIFSDGLVGVVRDCVRKGSKLYLEGQIQTRKWNDNDGVERYTTEIVLQGFDAKLVLLDAKKDDGGERQTHSRPASRAASPASHDIDDEIPF